MTNEKRRTRLLAGSLLLALLALPLPATEPETAAPRDGQDSRKEATPDAGKEKGETPATDTGKSAGDEAKAKVCRPNSANVNTLEELRAGDAERFDAALSPVAATEAAAESEKAAKKKPGKKDDGKAPGTDDEKP